MQLLVKILRRLKLLKYFNISFKSHDLNMIIPVIGGVGAEHLRITEPFRNRCDKANFYNRRS